MPLEMRRGKNVGLYIQIMPDFNFVAAEDKHMSSSSPYFVSAEFELFTCFMYSMINQLFLNFGVYKSANLYLRILFYIKYLIILNYLEDNS